MYSNITTYLKRKMIKSWRFKNEISFSNFNVNS